MKILFLYLLIVSSTCFAQYTGHVTGVAAIHNGGGSGMYAVTLDVKYTGTPQCGNSPFTSVVPIDSGIGDALYKVAISALLSGNAVSANIRDCSYWPAGGPNLYDLAICAPGVPYCSAFGPSS